MSRIHEVRDVAPERQAIWLAGQIDELDVSVSSASQALQAETKELRESLKSELGGVRKVLVGLLVSVIGLLIAFSTGLATILIQGHKP